MPDPTHHNRPSPDPGGGRWQHLGDAHALLSPFVGESVIRLRGNLPYEPPANRIPASVLMRERQQKRLQVTVNIPGVILGEAAWGAVGSGRELGPIFRATNEILEDLSRLGQHFMEIGFMPADRPAHLALPQFDYRMEVRPTDESRPHMGYLSVVFEFLEAEKQHAAQRAGDALDNIIGFCAWHGLQRTIQRIVDVHATKRGPLHLTPVELPLPEELSDPAVFKRLLPDEATDRAFKVGGNLGSGRPFVQFQGSTVHLRIPCSAATAEQWSYYLNEGMLAGRFGIASSYVPLFDPHSQIADLVGELSRSFAPFPDESPASQSSRKEPGYWHVRAPIDQQDPYGSLQAVLQFVTVFRGILLHGKEFWERQEPGQET